MGFTKKTVIIQWNTKKDLKLFATKLIEKITGPLNIKEHYQSFLKQKYARPLIRYKILNN